MPLANVFDFTAAVFFTLDVDLLQAPLIHEVVHVARTQGGIQRRIDRRIRHTHGTRLTIIHIHLQHGGIGHTVMTHLR